MPEAKWAPCPECDGMGGREEVIEHVTEEMARDAGQPDMEGEPIYGDVRCAYCGGTGIVAEGLDAD